MVVRLLAVKALPGNRAPNGFCATPRVRYRLGGPNRWDGVGSRTVQRFTQIELADRTSGPKKTMHEFMNDAPRVAVLFTWAFSNFAGKVRKGATQPFDDAIMHWIGAHQDPRVQRMMLEITSLGTGTVVGMIVLVAGMFLWLNHHRHSSILLIAATLGGLVLDNLLKIGFNRPRPQIFEWGTYAASSSFPSGHAMSSVIVYGTVTYLAARLQQRHLSRILTFVFAAVVASRNRSPCSCRAKPPTYPAPPPNARAS